MARKTEAQPQGLSGGNSKSLFVSPLTHTEHAQAEPPPVSLPVSLPLDPSCLIDLCTKLWRVDKGLAQIAKKDASADVQRLVRRFEELKEVLLQGTSVEIRDDTGQRYDAGLTVRVLTYQPVAGIAPGQEIILETVQPTVYHQGRLIAPGVVIVGVPLVEGEGSQPATSPTGDEGNPG